MQFVRHYDAATALTSRCQCAGEAPQRRATITYPLTFPTPRGRSAGGVRAAYAGGVLSDEQITAFQTDGSLVLPDFVTADACAGLRQRAVELVEQFEPSAARSVFTTHEQERTHNDEFLDSAANIWCFFEAEAFDEQEKALRELEQAKAELEEILRQLREEEIQRLLAALEETKVLEEEEQQTLEDAIAKLQEETEHSPLTHEKWETVDALQQRMRLRLEEASMDVSTAAQAAALLAPAASGDGEQMSAERLAELRAAKDFTKGALRYTSVRDLLEGAGANSSAEAIKLRTSTGTAAVAAIDRTGARAIEEQLVFAGIWAGATRTEAMDRITFEADTSYVVTELQLQTVSQFIAQNEKYRILSREALYRLLNKSLPGVLPTYEDNTKQLEAEQGYGEPMPE